MDDLELDPVRVVKEDRVVAGRVVVLLRATLDLGAVLAQPSGSLVDLPALVGDEGDVVDADRVTVVRDRVSVGLALAQAHLRVAGAADVDHALPALAGDLARLREAERGEELGVEGEAALQAGDDEVEMVDAGHGPILVAPGVDVRLA